MGRRRFRTAHEDAQAAQGEVLNVPFGRGIPFGCDDCLGGNPRGRSNW